MHFMPVSSAGCVYTYSYSCICTYRVCALCVCACACVRACVRACAFKIILYLYLQGACVGTSGQFVSSCTGWQGLASINSQFPLRKRSCGGLFRTKGDFRCLQIHATPYGVATICRLLCARRRGAPCRSCRAPSGQVHMRGKQKLGGGPSGS